jgi:transposase
VHDGWSAYDRFTEARHQQCLGHLLRRCHEMVETASASAAVFPRRIGALLHRALELRDRHLASAVSWHGLAVARGRLANDLWAEIWPLRRNPANERLSRHLGNPFDSLLTFLREPGLDATNGQAESAIRFGVILRKVWGGNRTWAGARAQAVLMSGWRTCWQQGRNAIDLLSGYLRGQRVNRASLPP